MSSTAIQINKEAVIKLFKELVDFDMCRSEYLLHIVIYNFINYKL